MKMILIDELIKLPQVDAIALGGSRAGENFDEKSDYDIYVYCKEMIPEEVRYEMFSKYCSKLEIGNHFWEYEDNGTLNDGVDFDILYRDLDDFEKGIKEVVMQGIAHNGYTTCMWHNLINSKILYDKNGEFEKVQKKYTVQYPDKLRENIIDNNMKLLRTALPAYELQIAKAVKRNDLVSINHRVAEFMASYFDIIFALNKLTHPGEKRLLELSIKNCTVLPCNFKENIEQLFKDMYINTGKVEEDIDRIITELEKVI